MVGAHLDSWTGATGATDNAIGCAVTMEAMRILHDLKLPMDRTVRMALWSGEEGGGLGSKGYVKEHAADLHEKLYQGSRYSKTHAEFSPSLFRVLPIGPAAPSKAIPIVIVEDGNQTPRQRSPGASGGAFATR